MYGLKSFAVRSLCVLALGSLSPVVLGTGFGHGVGVAATVKGNSVPAAVVATTSGTTGAAASGSAGGASVVTPAAAPATAPPVEAAQLPSGSGPDAISWGAFSGVVTFFYAVICTAERGNNPDGWFAKNCRPQDWLK